jgi:hypothetical protein
MKVQAAATSFVAVSPAIFLVFMATSGRTFVVAATTAYFAYLLYIEAAVPLGRNLGLATLNWWRAAVVLAGLADAAFVAFGSSTATSPFSGGRVLFIGAIVASRTRAGATVRS